MSQFALFSHLRLGLVLIGTLCIGSVAGALAAQHGFDMQPCPWCILQRILFLLTGFIALGSAMLPAGPLQRFSPLLTIPSSLAGAAAALYQNQVAAKLASCDMTLADRIISGLGLDALMPEVFEVRASCAEAAVKLLGVPFELWSMALFVLLALYALLLRLAARQPA